jgi:hypothetical protein
VAIKTQLILVVTPLLVLIGAPLAYADTSYDMGYNAAKFDFLHHKSYDTLATPIVLGTNWDTLKHGIR